jgi:hypothetical protein
MTWHVLQELVGVLRHVGYSLEEAELIAVRTAMRLPPLGDEVDLMVPCPDCSGEGNCNCKTSDQWWSEDEIRKAS